MPRNGPQMNAVLTDDEVGILLTAAVHAPSIHNTQPWRFEVHGPVIDVLLDEERTLPVADPAGRAARIGIGAAVFNIRVAAAMLGHESRVAANPDPQYPEMAARIFLADREAPVPVLSSLYGEIRPAAHVSRSAARPRRSHRRCCSSSTTRLGPKVLDCTGSARRGVTARRAPSAYRRRRPARRGPPARTAALDRRRPLGRRDPGERARSAPRTVGLRPRPVRRLRQPHRSQAVYETQPAIAVLSTPDEDTARLGATPVSPCSGSCWWPRRTT